MGLEGFEIFDESEDGGPGSLEAIMALINHSIDEHGMHPKDGIKILFDLMFPGHTDTSHDVRPIWVGAMYSLGFGDVCENFGSIYVNSMPWGVGFSIGVLPEFNFYALSVEAQHAVVRSLGVTLEAGGLNVEYTGGNMLKITRPKDEDEDEESVTTVNIDDIVSRFTREMETELPRLLGDDPDDPTRKWYP